MKKIGRPKEIIYPELPYRHSPKVFYETLFRKGVIEVKDLGRFEVRKMKKSRMKYNNFADKMMRVGGGVKVHFTPCDKITKLLRKLDPSYMGEYWGFPVYVTKNTK